MPAPKTLSGHGAELSVTHSLLAVVLELLVSRVYKAEDTSAHSGTEEECTPTTEWVCDPGPVGASLTLSSLTWPTRAVPAEF